MIKILTLSIVVATAYSSLFTVPSDFLTKAAGAFNLFNTFDSSLPIYSSFAMNFSTYNYFNETNTVTSKNISGL